MRTGQLLEIQGQAQSFRADYTIMEPIPKFTPRPTPSHFSIYGRWPVFLLVAILIAPTAAVLAAFFRGHALLGFVGATIWLPALWFMLLWLHKQGIIRLMLTVPMLITAAVVLAFSLANP